MLRPHASAAACEERGEASRRSGHGLGASSRGVVTGPGAAAAFRPRAAARPQQDAAPPALQQPPPRPAEAPPVPRRDVDDGGLEVRRRGVLQQLVADVDVGRVEVDAAAAAGVVAEAAAAAAAPAPGPRLREDVTEAGVLDAAAAPAAAPTRWPGTDGGARRRGRRL